MIEAVGLVKSYGDVRVLDVAAGRRAVPSHRPRRPVRGGRLVRAYRIGLWETIEDRVGAGARPAHHPQCLDESTGPPTASR